MNTAKFTQTKAACCLGMVTAAVVNNFAPLLFSVFRNEYGISLRSVSALIAANFLAQSLGALSASVLIRRAGHRITISAAHCVVGIGLLGLAAFPALFPSPFPDIAAAIFICGIGGGIVNVAVNPVIEDISVGKTEERSFIYSFYCWGFILVVAASTAALGILGISNWRIMARIWAVITFGVGICFMNAPIAVRKQRDAPVKLWQFVTEKSFFRFVLLMLCAGAAEQSMSQWASLFAENGLGVSKAVGDIAGPCFFAASMGVSRTVYSRIGRGNRHEKYMFASALICVLGYLLVAFAPSPAVSLLGCGLIGLSAGILWPGTLSLSSARFGTGGASMFAALVLAGNAGCAAGPTVVGVAAGSFHSMKAGLLIGAIFPAAFAYIMRSRIRKSIFYRQTEKRGT
jgi:fucose permease